MNKEGENILAERCPRRNFSRVVPLIIAGAVAGVLLLAATLRLAQIGGDLRLTQLLLGVCLVLYIASIALVVYAGSSWRPWHIGLGGRDQSIGLFVFGWFLSCFSFWYIGQYPGGVILTDTSIILSSVIGAVGYVPYSTFWCAFNGGLYSLFGTLQVIPLFNIVLASIVLAMLFSAMRRFGVGFVPLITLIFLLSFTPALPSSVILWSHDTTNWIVRIGIVTYCLVCLAGKANSNVSLGFNQVFALAAAIAAAILLRTENWPLILVIPFLLFHYGLMSKRLALTLLVATLCHVGCFELFIGKRIYDKAGNPSYILSIAANPVRYFYNNKFTSPNSVADRALMEKIYGRDWLAGVSFSYAPYHTKGLLPRPHSSEELEQLKSMLFRLLSENPELFVQNRIVLARVLMSGGKSVDYHALGNSFDTSSRLIPIFLSQVQAGVYQQLAQVTNHRSEFAAQVTNKIRSIFDPRVSGDRLLPRIFWSLFPGSAMIIFGVFFVVRRSIVGLVSGILILPLSAVLLFAPAPHFKYIADIFVWGLVLPILLVIDIVSWRHQKFPREGL